MPRVLRRASLVLIAASVLAWPAPAPAVVGGHPADPSAHPWLVGDGGCTGALVAPDRIVTAAHCVEGGDPADERWFLGAVPARTGRPLTIAAIGTHPRWVPLDRQREVSGHDLAVLRVDPPVLDVPPLRMAGPADAALAAAGARVTTVGWGATAAAGTPARPDFPGPSPTPNAGELTVVDRASCERWYRNAPSDPGPVPPATICAGDLDGPPLVSPCVGDSGGPLLATDPEGLPVMVGVFSFMHRCGADGDPSVHGDVAAAASFLTAASPVWAPRRRTAPRVVGRARVGGTVRCTGARFAGRVDRLRYRWIVAGRATLKLPAARSPRHTVGRAERGRRIACEVLAANAGGHVLSRLSVPRRVAG
jgi:secreted trypsin-like serine protease